MAGAAGETHCFKSVIYLSKPKRVSVPVSVKPSDSIYKTETSFGYIGFIGFTSETPKVWKIMTKKWQRQEAQLSPMDRAMRHVSWNSAKCCTNVCQIAFDKFDPRLLEMAIWYLLLLLCSNNMSILHHFFDTNTFMMYVTVRGVPNLEKSSIFRKQLRLKDTHTFLFMYTHNVTNRFHIHWWIGISKVSNS